ncbi:BREX-1 system adenine-specific DNA-methyltransferase PglX [Agathobacter ruminis]|uniref:site-specific DNA-methyltransferase (adenine-specific) n=1 Tax=Agathobacter ruminis TaxID=1712665 RepID=A0A2G3E6U1_9FIRM|nr:BREX-1 system adenine-specific DNA-methyltransferase PglX [Agathobacter ruminis]MDC7301009.1 BREX-1 system adenine-specific DNA-methyltransferase PglX [Agathobacter ruminis]PHU38957.1 restriction endonuclease [Agathobacter ruminis]
MNKTAIRNFAIWARNKLIADIEYRAGLMGITSDGIKDALPQSTRETQFFDIGTVEPYAITGEAIKQRDSLVNAINQKAHETDYATAYKYIIEGVAYTWFNRLIAVRFMEVNDYLPSHIRVLSSESGKMEPDLVTNPFDAELPFTDDEKQEIIRLKNDNELDECFRMLFIKQCNALNEILPALFEKTSDYTEVLLNISAIDKEGVVYHLVNDIPEEDFNIEMGGQVEIIGWMYQYYNTEPKNEAFAKNGKISKEEIPAVTQLFTPDWIVRYMVENSLGRIWVEGHPNDSLKAGWKYYLEEAEQEPDVQNKLNEIHAEYAKLNPEDIHFIDPCMGSGHILVYAFDVLMQIYESAGYSERDAARSILENNLYGLDIDDRAYQMAYFAVMMKARQYNRRILSAETPCHVYSIQDSNSINRNQLQYFGAGLSELEKNDALNQITGLLDTFKDAKEYGSILDVENYNWELLKKFAGSHSVEGQMSLDTIGIDDTQEKLFVLISIGETMARKYEAVITNPPYMAVSSASKKLGTYIRKRYPNSKTDMFSVFIEVCASKTRRTGYYAMITQHAWMFLKSFEKLRENLCLQRVINMAHLGARAFDDIGGEVVQTTSFVMSPMIEKQYISKFVNLVDGGTSLEKETMFLSNECINLKKIDEFEYIPGIPFAYWASFKDLLAFKNIKLGEVAEPRAGLQTNNNDLFVRMWQEVSKENTKTNSIDSEDAVNSKKTWFPYNKGGSFRRWYGNNELLVNWRDKGLDIHNYAGIPLSYSGAPVRAKQFYFKKSVTWSAIASGKLSVRYCDNGFVFDTKGSSCFFQSHEETMVYLALLNSCVTQKFISFLAPTLDYSVGAMSKIPIGDISKKWNEIIALSDNNVKVSKCDWDEFEQSWDYMTNPLTKGVRMGRLIADKYKEWEAECDSRFNQLKANEEELNRIFIDIYGLQDELTPEVDDKDVTVRKADLQRDIKSLLSYAVGCMFGRYSLDVEGLAYAGGEWDASKYKTFIPDADNILPITDEEYFEDDIVGLFIGWLKKVYGEDTLEQNLDFIAQALGNKGNSSREIIRNYFVSDFFKDHCQTYSVTGSGKRPIYWLFDSGKQNGFKALIYLHRYNADTIGNLRVDYLHRMQRVYESEIGRMQDMIDHSTNSREVGAATKRKEKLQKQLKECRDYDEKIGHLALARTELDLDDGVKYNYKKVQLGTDGKLYEVLADSKAIMMDDKKFKDFKKN